MAPKLDRIPHFDPRSRNYGIAQLITPTPIPRKRVWNVRPVPLDQGSEGACVGFGWAAELAATPWRYSVNDAFARDLYQMARTEDRNMGNNWDEGASVLAGAKACKAMGWLKSYRWAFTLQEVIDAIIKLGPVVLGINWYSGMYDTRPGEVDERQQLFVDGEVVGGHCILANGYIPAGYYGDHGEMLVLTNSWGQDWGENGSAFIAANDLERLLKENGEACIPVDAPIRYQG